MAVPFPFKSPVTVVESVIAGVDVDVATVPASPFADTTETSVTVPVPPIAISPVPRSDWELIVLILVPETSVSCFASNADWVAVLTGLSASLVLSTLQSPTCDLETECGLDTFAMCASVTTWFASTSDWTAEIAVCVAVETGSSERAASIALPAFEVSESNTLSSAAGVPLGIQFGNITSLI